MKNNFDIYEWRSKYAKKELQTESKKLPKFKNIPSWAKYVAQHSDGEWFFYEETPTIIKFKSGGGAWKQDGNQIYSGVKTDGKDWDKIPTYYNVKNDKITESVNEGKTYKKGDKLKIKLKNGKEFDLTFDSYGRQKGMAFGKFKDGSGEYDTKPFSLDTIKESVNEAEEDPIDIITMDVPLFIRILEYSREDAQEDMDLHDLTEKAIEATKQQGILQMDDYDMLVGDKESIEESNLERIKEMLNQIEEKNPGLWANINAKQKRGEKPAHGNSNAFKSAVKAGNRINKAK